MKKTIPVYQPTLGEAARLNVLDCIDTNWISSKGVYIDKFERAFSEKTGVGYTASVSNGTVALHLALLALDVKAGDEVIVPTFTYIASVNAINYVGAIPVFIDSISSSWQLNPDDLIRKITPRTKAIMAVHLYGQPANMPLIMEIAEKYGLYVVEDCAEAFGSYIGAKHVGSWGHVSTYSFFGNKTITTGEGGAVVSNSVALIERIRKLRGQGLAGSKEYWHDEVGYNYRMTNICAAIGLGQLGMADGFISRKREIASKFRFELKDLPLEFMWELPGTTSSFWMNTILLNDRSDREKIRLHLSNNGVETRPAFYPAHTMPMYSKFATENYPVALELSARGINLPSAPALTDDDLIYIIDLIKQFYIA